MIVLDASAIVAILTREPECEALMAVLERANSAEASPIAVFGASLALRRKRGCSVAEAEAAVMEFLTLTARDGRTRAAHDALEVHSRNGKGTGHPAQLNLGDCFVYAHAASVQAALLFKGDDFSRTDVERAR